jgi:hypothetical protein
MAPEHGPEPAQRARCRRALRAASAELARFVLPVLLARVRCWTGALEGAGAAGALDAEGEEVRSAGFVLGVIAAARGVDLLRARREVDGLRAVARWVEAASGARLSPGVEALPRLATNVGQGWELAFLGGYLILRAARESHGEELRWELERVQGSSVILLPMRAAGAWTTSLADLACLVPGAGALVLHGRSGFRWPSQWLVD